MNLLPFENIEIDSPLTKSEIENAIMNNIAWTTQLGNEFSKNSSREYEGFVENGTFKIRRNLKNWYSAFIPIVSGTISEEGNNGSRVSLKLRLHKFVMILFLSITIFSGFRFISQVLTTHELSKEEAKAYFIEHGIDEEFAKEIVSHREDTTVLKRINWANLLIFIAPYLMTTIFYNHEAAIIKDRMRSMLKA